MTNKKSVSIIIPNYNGKHLLEKYLKYAYIAADNAKVDYEIIIVDDASTDDSVSFLKEHYPSVVLLQNTKNRGFSYSCNQGLKCARFELILLLNSDVKLSPDYFEHQWRYFEQPDTFGVMGRIMSVDNSKIEDAARYMNLTGGKIKASRFFYSKNSSDYTPTTYLSGANALIFKDKLRSIGGFDEIFSPFYSEDFELGLRAWRLGWKCYYEHRSICFHQISASTSKYETADWVKHIYYRNKFLLHAIHLNGPLLYLYFLQLIFIDLLPKVLCGKLWIIKSHLAFFQHTDEIRRSKERLAELMTAHNSSLSIADVKRKLQDNLQNRNLVWF
jgi:GT2 family glycosyltransferase